MALWAAFPTHIKDEIRKQLESFSENDEIVSFGIEDVDSLKRRLLIVAIFSPGTEFGSLLSKTVNDSAIKRVVGELPRCSSATGGYLQ